MGSDAFADLLLELGCEELPPLSIDTLRDALFTGIADGLEKANVAFDRESSSSFSTPRRLAVLLANVGEKQPDQVIDRRGPAVAAAFDDRGNPTKAAEGFARSVGMEVGDLKRLETDKGEWLYCKQHVEGKPLGELLFDIIADVLRQLPVPRPMRWSDHDFSFVRPVHWVVVLHGDNVLEGEVLGKESGRLTFGHRIHAPGPHELRTTSDYEATLLDARVIADPDARKKRIAESARAEDDRVILDPGLVDEVKNLVEWPVAVPCRFDEEFLEVPHEALIASMQDHQKFFPVRAAGDNTGGISNRFIAISNIESTDLAQVRAGYERVIRPRLADARFFLEQDEKKPLSDYAPLLDDVVFQEKIGTIGDKTRRIVEISKKLCAELGVDEQDSVRAAELCKCDLMTQMVGEFPELQGVMGAYYATRSGETEAVALGIGEHYAPRFAGDDIPASEAGRVVSATDRADTLVAIFAAGLPPSGNKDPFALRRAALGLVRVLSEAPMAVPPRRLFTWAAESLADSLKCNETVIADVEAFMLQRARGHYRDRGYKAELITAAVNAPWKDIPDLDARLDALRGFMGREEAESLATANKRIGNILRKSDDEPAASIREDLLHLDEEWALFDEVRNISQQIEPLMLASDYSGSLEALAVLRMPVDAFFDTVMVMDEDSDLRRNRLALLARLKGLFDEIADLSVLG